MWEVPGGQRQRGDRRLIGHDLRPFGDRFACLGRPERRQRGRGLVPRLFRVDGLDRDGNRMDHRVQFIQRAQSRNHPTLIVADVMDHEIHPEPFHSARCTPGESVVTISDRLS